MPIAIFSECYRLPIFPSFFDLRPDTEYVIMISRCSSCAAPVEFSYGQLLKVFSYIIKKYVCESPIYISPRDIMIY